MKTSGLYLSIIIACLALFSTVNSNAQITINYSDESASLNQEVVVDVTVIGFDSVQSFQMVTGWDTNRLEFVGTENINAQFPIGYLAFSPPSVTGKNGRLGLVASTSDDVYYSIGNSDPIFAIRFKVVSPAAACTEVDTLDESAQFRGNWFFVNSTNTRVTAGGNPGEIDIENGCSGGGGDITISVPTGLEAQPDAEICIPVQGDDLADVGSMQGLLFVYDNDILEYTGIIQTQAPFGSGTVFDLGGGILNLQFLYSDNQGGGISGDVDLFLLCFDVIGECNDETNLLLQEDNFAVFNSVGTELTTDLEDGSFKINCNPCSPEFTVTDETCPGDNDGIIVIDLVGGCEGATYQWTDNVSTDSVASNLAPGKYSVTITYGSPPEFIILSDIMVNGKEAPSEDDLIITKDDGGCKGAIDIEISGGAQPLTYKWSNGATTEDITDLCADSYTLTVTDDDDCEFVFGPYDVGTLPKITECTASGVTCFGDTDGFVDITVEGGETPYTYQWSCPGTVSPSGDLSDVGAGTCTVTVTDDSGEQITKTVEVPGPNEAISAEATITHDDNNDGNGAIELTVSGGWGNYTYLWSNGATTKDISGLFGGSYTLTIEDQGGCVAEFGPFVLEGLRIEGEVTGIKCFGDNNGSIDITITGGSGNYSCSWSCEGTVTDCDLLDITTGGTCTVTVTDINNSRIATKEFIVPGPETAITSVTDYTCVDDEADGTATVQVSGGVPPYSYEWSTVPTQTTPTAVGLEKGTYMVRVIDDLDCEHINTVNVENCFDGECFTSVDVITPNEDGMNDHFIIHCADRENNRLQIFTRRGQPVREYVNYANTWDGRDEGGNLVDEDTYLWVLEVTTSNGITTIYKGAVSVLYELR